MKFVVEIEEFWIEEDELATSLARKIKEDIVQQMKKTVDEKIDNQITVRVQKVIDEHITNTIKEKLNELVAIGTIMRDGKVINLNDHIAALFNNNQGWNNPREQILAMAKKFGDEIKQRYDAIFANRLIVKMNENGMLKEEVVKLMIESS